MKIRFISVIAAVLLTIISVSAQIGYQVVVIDQTKGEPKANTNVSVDVTLTDNVGTVICHESESATTDDFGILSLQIGNSTTFDNVDWSKLPLWISAKVDGVTISKTQVLSVPVAEHAKHSGVLTLEKLCSKTWTAVGVSDYHYRFNKNMKYTRSYTGSSASGVFCIFGDMVMLKYTVTSYDNGGTITETYGKLLAYMESEDALIDVEEKRIYR